MNHRIQEFILQCTDTIEIVNEDSGITHHREFFDHEKFAELIVWECEKVIRAEIAVTDISGEVEKAWEMGMECGVGLIKKHFGVKE
jgi:hypothetical protein